MKYVYIVYNYSNKLRERTLNFDLVQTTHPNLFLLLTTIALKVNKLQKLWTRLILCMKLCMAYYHLCRHKRKSFAMIGAARPILSITIEL